jgi:arginine repressor
MKDIPSIREDLKKCKPADLANNSDKPLSNREAVKQLAPTLLKMRERGFTSNDLVELLNQHQIAVKIRDLSRYLREFQGEKNTEEKTGQAKNMTCPPETSPRDMIV